jgi:hypothetical protein
MKTADYGNSDANPRLVKNIFVEYLYYYVRWCASLQPPTIYAKSSSAYNA